VEINVLRGSVPSIQCFGRVDIESEFGCNLLDSFRTLLNRITRKAGSALEPDGSPHIRAIGPGFYFPWRTL
jgi:hypothetical protein